MTTTETVYRKSQYHNYREVEYAIADGVTRFDFRDTWTIGALMRPAFRAQLDQLLLTASEQKGLVDSFFTFNIGTLRQAKAYVVLSYHYDRLNAFERADEILEKEAVVTRKNKLRALTFRKPVTTYWTGKTRNEIADMFMTA